jgi:hypothetical protein
MSDIAHKATDDKLVAMERNIHAIYSRAHAEVLKKSEEYFSAFERLDKEKREHVKKGIITEEEYIRWRRGKVIRGARFTVLKEQCAEQILHANDTAVAYVNGELPEVYAMNYNALSSDVDGVGGYSFTLTDADTVKNLATSDKSFLPYK